MITEYQIGKVLVMSDHRVVVGEHSEVGTYLVAELLKGFRVSLACIWPRKQSGTRDFDDFALGIQNVCATCYRAQIDSMTA